MASWLDIEALSRYWRLRRWKDNSVILISAIGSDRENKFRVNTHLIAHTTFPTAASL